MALFRADRFPEYLGAGSGELGQLEGTGQRYRGACCGPGGETWESYVTHWWKLYVQ